MLSLRILGPARIDSVDAPIRLKSRKQLALLCFLASVAPARQSREKLAALLWGEHAEENARQSLRQALKELRARLPDGTIVAIDDTLALSAEHVDCDLWRFLRLVEDGSPPALAEAVVLYRGPLVEDVSVKEEPWEDWLAGERQRLQDVAVDALVRDANNSILAREFNAAITSARRAISLDPFREDAYRNAITAAAACGRRSDAFRLYEDLREQLAHELGVEPDESTTLLVRELQTASTVRAVDAEPAEQVPAQAPAVVDRRDPGVHRLQPGFDLEFDQAAWYHHTVGFAETEERVATLRNVPSIAVLPFSLPADDQTLRYLANGLIEDIVVSLGALRELAVIARGATLSWAGALQDARAIGRILGVRYVLRGSIQKDRGRLRVTPELRETEEGDSIWAVRIEIALAELFEMQDAIVERTVQGIAPTIRAAELRRALRKRPESLSAYDLTLRGMYGLEGLRRETFEEAGNFLRRAMGEDPAFSVATAWASQWHSLAVGQSWSADPKADAAAAGVLAGRSIELDPRNALGLAFMGHFTAYHQRDPLTALPYYDKALTACPSQALAWTLRSASLSYLGRGAEALQAAERGFMLWPHGSERFYFQFFIALANYVCGNCDEAVRWGRRSLADNPTFTSAHKVLMAALAAIGQLESAQLVREQMMALEPNFSLTRYEAERVPVVDPALRRRLIDDMRSAGAPG